MADRKFIAVEHRPGGFGLALWLPLAGRLNGLGPDVPTHAAALAAALVESHERGGLVIEDRTEAGDASGR